MANKQAGHTLVSLIIALAIFAAVSLSGVFTLSGAMDRAKRRADGEGIRHFLHGARESALYRGKTLAVCAGRLQCGDGEKFLRLFEEGENGGENLREYALRHRRARVVVRGAFGRESLPFPPLSRPQSAGSVYYCAPGYSLRFARSAQGRLREEAGGASPCPTSSPH